MTRRSPGVILPARNGLRLSCRNKALPELDSQASHIGVQGVSGSSPRNTAKLQDWHCSLDRRGGLQHVRVIAEDIFYQEEAIKHSMNVASLPCGRNICPDCPSESGHQQKRRVELTRQRGPAARCR